MKTLHADVWIIGSGAAGLMAAIAARRRGAQVVVLGKEAPGRGTATERSGGALAGAWEGLSEEDQKARTRAAGRGINQPELVHVLAADGPHRFRELIDWGLPHRSTRGALRALRRAGDEPGEIPLWGIEIVRCLAAQARALGVAFLDPAVVTKIRAGEDGVRLSAFGSDGDGRLELLGGAVVLAAGGAGGLYLHHDNPPRAIGDSYALALDAGAELRDMEFVQFYPATLAVPGKPRNLLEPDEADRGAIVNGRGEDILAKYALTERPAARHARDRLSQALFREMEMADGEIFIDLTHMSKSDWLANSLTEIRWNYLDCWYDAFARPLRIAPVAHFVVGGVTIDVDGATSVPGLFAAGEAAGGLHGANRMGGNSLAETVVFGQRAGGAAAAWAQGRDQGRDLARDQSTIPPPAPSERVSRIGADTLTDELRHVMWRQAGILRDSAGLAQGLDRVREIQAEAVGTGVQSAPTEQLKFIELQLACVTAELIIEAATRRRESRGVHFRTDFPATDDAQWRGNLKVTRRDGRLDWRFDGIPSAGDLDTD